MPAPVLIDLDPEADAETAVAALGVTFEQIRDELLYRRRAKLDRCLKESALAAKTGGQRRILRGDGGGEVEMMIHPFSYHYWGQRLGYECWDDPQFRREYRRDVETSRVRSISDRLTITNAATFGAKSRIRGRRGRWAA